MGSHLCIPFKLHMIIIYPWEKILAAMLVTLGQGHTATKAVKILT